MSTSNGSNVWRRSRPIFLPDGQRIVARRLSVLSMLSQGLIPDRLTNIVLKVRRGELKGVEENVETLKDLAALVDVVVPHILVEPRCFNDEMGQIISEDAEAIPVSEISDANKTWLFNYSQGAPVPQDWIDRAEKAGLVVPEDVPDLAPFRPVGSSPDSGDAGGSIPPAPVGSDRDSPGGGGTPAGL